MYENENPLVPRLEQVISIVYEIFTSMEVDSMHLKKMLYLFPIIEYNVNSVIMRDFKVIYDFKLVDGVVISDIVEKSLYGKIQGLQSIINEYLNIDNGIMTCSQKYPPIELAVNVKNVIKITAPTFKFYDIDRLVDSNKQLIRLLDFLKE